MDSLAALELLEYLHTGYPIFLLILFAIAFVANTILTARKHRQNDAQEFGPGGRLLPQRSRGVPYKPQEFSRNVKRLFTALSVAIPLTFIADATIYILHVMTARSENWWRGQSAVVCSLMVSRRVVVNKASDRFTSSARSSCMQCCSWHS